MKSKEQIAHEVEPSRLEVGTWCNARQREIGEGDIAASYSADTIALHGKVRTPFGFRGALWVCVGVHSGDRATAYRLVPHGVFNGEATTYHEKTFDGETARSDLNGFYHGMTVGWAKREWVLSGPPEQFLAGTPSQLDLFGIG